MITEVVVEVKKIDTLKEEHDMIVSRLKIFEIENHPAHGELKPGLLRMRLEVIERQLKEIK